ncbi:hypothetical protein [Sphaerotilus microaerophilus]|uniref:GGDEF domain-containing protein n=1 Tax=Sphaerotilus microaerophilus TaxID=2914710 RepID=A0ABN6PK54_9BURK|nr:hypothetical protein [Sphaerotilus sp. FB-5]BDI05556.1 hypothetical protein CATMQ487_25260 [Sphaerotilus sp. FB-5]
MAELLQLQQAQHPGQGLTVSFSAGITELAVDEDIDLAIDRADRAMYRAKVSGHRRCELG